MISRFGLLLTRLRRNMWLRAASFSLLGVLTALAAIVLQTYIPAGLSAQIGADAVGDILTILASGMLSVTTFSLGVAVTALNWAAANATPRATKLLVEDPITQNVLSTFVGIFLFSLVGLVALRMGAYGAEGRVVLFAVTIGVIITIVGTLLRWISHLMTIGRMSDTLQRVEDATTKALRMRLSEPNLGCTPMPHGYRMPHGNNPIHADRIGYVQHIAMAELAGLADKNETRIAISALPGTFADPHRELAYSEKELKPDQRAAVAAAFTIESSRTFHQDPRFGVIVLGEIASRALSPGINDPGTAIEVIGRLVRILHMWSAYQDIEDEPKVRYPQLFAPKIELADVFDDAFTSIAHDAAAIISVNIRLQKAFAALALNGSDEVRTEAARHSEMAWLQAANALPLEQDRQVLRDLRRTVLEPKNQPKKDEQRRSELNTAGPS